MSAYYFYVFSGLFKRLKLFHVYLAKAAWMMHIRSQQLGSSTLHCECVDRFLPSQPSVLEPNSTQMKTSPRIKGDEQYRMKKKSYDHISVFEQFYRIIP